MTPSRIDRETHRLIDALIDDKCDAQTLADINRRLEGDAAFRQHYIQFMGVESELHALHAADQIQPAASRRQIDASKSRWSISPWLVVAASLALVAAGSAWTTYLLTRPDGRSIAQRDAADHTGQATPTADAVAFITGTRDCRWAAAHGDTGYGAPLVAGQQLELEQGLAEITFRNGSRLVLEGPSTFVVPDGDRVKLLAGRLSAAVPDTAVGFSIETDRLAVDSAGTQFGLVADGDGTNEVHVFDGPVEARVKDMWGAEVNRVNLDVTEAARLAPVSGKLAKMSADSNRFVRTLSPTTGPSEGLLAVEEFDYPAGPVALQNGGFGWAGAWVELNRAETDDDTPTNKIAPGSLLGSTLISRGNRVSQTGQFNRIRRVLSTSLNSVFDVEGLVEDQNGTQLIGREGRTVYVSFLQRASETDDLFYGLELHRADGNLNRVLCIGRGAEFTGYGVSSNYNGRETPESDRTVCIPLFESLGDEDTNTHLFVVRIDYGPGHQDVATVYRDPDSLLDEEACTATATLRGDFAFDRISIANYDGIKGKIHDVDEIRLGTSFTAVTGHRASSDRRMASRPDPLSTNEGFAGLVLPRTSASTLFY